MAAVQPSAALKSPGLPLEILRFEPMASGQQSLRLTERVTWEQFGPYADALVAALDGRVTARADSPVERVWAIEIAGAGYWLALDDFGLGVSLDPRDAVAGAAMDRIRRRLLDIRDPVTS